MRFLMFILLVISTCLQGEGYNAADSVHNWSYHSPEEGVLCYSLYSMNDEPKACRLVLRAGFVDILGEDMEVIHNKKAYGFVYIDGPGYYDYCADFNDQFSEPSVFMSSRASGHIKRYIPSGVVEAKIFCRDRGVVLVSDSDDSEDESL